MPKNISTIIINLVGIGKMKTEEMTTKLADFHWLLKSFDSQFSLVYFSGGKCLFAGQLLRFNVHNALQYYVRQSDVTERFNLNCYNRSTRYII